MRFTQAKDPILSEADKLYLRFYIACHVVIHPDTGCWVWVGTHDQRYGKARFNGRCFKAHRIAYLVFNGPLLRHQIVDHDPCNRGMCANPAHLKATTQSENIKRAFRVGRGRSPFLQQQTAEVEEEVPF